MSPMNLFYVVLTLGVVSTGLAVGQTKPVTRPQSTTATKSATTSRPAATARPTTTTNRPTPRTTATSPGLTVTQAASTTTANPNRQQELYDQYHGTSKKATTAPAAAPATATKTAPATRPERSSAPVQTASQRESAEPTSSDETSGVRVGLRGGVTYLYNFDSDIETDPAISFIGGLVFNFGKGAVSFQPEINYARYGVKSDLFGTTITAAFDQIEVPLLLKIATANASQSRLFINVGPYGSYLLNISLDGKTQSLDGVKGRFGFGAAAGIGGSIKAGPGHLTVEVRGLYPLGDTDGGFSTDSKTILGQGTLGYVFPLGGR